MSKVQSVLKCMAPRAAQSWSDVLEVIYVRSFEVSGVNAESLMPRLWYTFAKMSLASHSKSTTISFTRLDLLAYFGDGRPTHSIVATSYDHQ